METFKANFLILLFFGVTIWLGYWSITSIISKPSDDFAKQEVVKVSPVMVSEPVGSDGPSVSTPSENQPATVPTTPTSTTQTSNTHRDLIAGLQKLVDDNVLMKSGSRGTRVGIVQEFLNLYTGVDAKIDNDYGPGTETKIRNFQRENGLTADGQTGPNTYRKMIEWLNQQ